MSGIRGTLGLPLGGGDEKVVISDVDCSHLRGGDCCSSTIGGETVDWTEESETADWDTSESDSISFYGGRMDEEELARDTMHQGGVFGGNAGHQSQPRRAPSTADGPQAIDRYEKNAPRNIILPANPASPLDRRHGCQARNPDVTLYCPQQWRVFHGLDSNWLIDGRDDGNTDNSAAVNNEKQWAFERSIALAQNYTAFNGQGYKGEMEDYPLQASADLVGGGARPLTLAPRDTELLGTLDPATSVQYAFEHPRMSLRAQSQSQRGRNALKFKPRPYVDSRLGMSPNTPNPPPQEPRQAAFIQQQSAVDAQLHGETGMLSSAFAYPSKGIHDHKGSKEKPPFPISPPLPVDYNPFARSSPRQGNERASFPMSPVPPADKLFHGRPTSVWQGGNFFEGLDTAPEPVRLESVERSQKGPFPLSPALDGPRLTPSEVPTPSSIFGSPAARRQNQAWAEGDDTAPAPAVREGSRSLGGGRGGQARVLMPTVPQTRRVADKAIRAARQKHSLAIRGRKPVN